MIRKFYDVLIHEGGGIDRTKNEFVWTAELMSEFFTTFGAPSHWVTPERMESFIRLKTQREWEILSYVDCEAVSDQPIAPINSSHPKWNIAVVKGFPIRSIKRLSDGETFTIGDMLQTFQRPISKIRIDQDAGGKMVLICGQEGISLNIAKKQKQPIFTTVDGVDIFSGMDFYIVNHAFNIIGTRILPGKEEWDKPDFENFKHFFKKSAAEEYVLMNKPVLCLNDLLEPYKKIGAPEFVTTELVELFKNVVKERIGQKAITPNKE